MADSRRNNYSGNTARQRRKDREQQGAQPVQSRTKANTADTRGRSGQTQRGGGSAAPRSVPFSGTVKPSAVVRQDPIPQATGGVNMVPGGTANNVARAAAQAVQNQQARRENAFRTLDTLGGRLADAEAGSRNAARYSNMYDAAFQRLAGTYAPSRADIASISPDRRDAFAAISRDKAGYALADRRFDRFVSDAQDAVSDAERQLRRGLATQDDYDVYIADVDAQLAAAKEQRNAQRNYFHQDAELNRAAFGGYSGGVAGDEYRPYEMPHLNVEDYLALNPRGEDELKRMRLMQNLTESGAFPALEGSPQASPEFWQDRADAFRSNEHGLYSDYFGDAWNTLAGAAHSVEGGFRSFAETDAQYSRNSQVNSDNAAWRKAESEAEMWRQRWLDGEQGAYKKYLEAHDRALSLGDYTPVDLSLPGQQLNLQSQREWAASKEGKNKIQEILMTALQTTIQQIPYLAVGAAVGNPMIGAAVSTGLMSAQAAGNYMTNATAAGMGAQDAFAEGLLMGGVEFATEYMGAEMMLSALLGKAGMSFRGTLAKIAGAEGLEEIIADPLDYGVQVYYHDPNAQISLSDVLESGAVGVLSGLFLGGGAVGIRSAVNGGFRNAGLDESMQDEIDAAWKQYRDFTQSRFEKRGELLRVFLESGMDAADAEELADYYDSIYGEQYEQAREESQQERMAQPEMLDEQRVQPAAEPENVREPKIDERTEENAQNVPNLTLHSQISEEEIDRSMDTIRAAADELGIEHDSARDGQKAQKVQKPDSEKSAPAAPDGYNVYDAAQQAMSAVQAHANSRVFGEFGSDSFRTGYTVGTDPETYFKDFARAYNAGLEGRGLESVSDSSLTDAQKIAAYKAGTDDVVATDRKFTAGRTRAADAGAYFEQADIRAIDRSMRRVIDRVAKALGVRVTFSDNLRGNGLIKGNDIIISRTALARGNPVSYIFGHEFTHRLQTLAPSEYSDFRRHFLGLADAEQRIDAEMRQNPSISRAEAIDEATSTFAGELLADTKTLKHFAASAPRTAIHRLLTFLRDIVGKLTGAERRNAENSIAILEKAYRAGKGNLRNVAWEGENAELVHSPAVNAERDAEPEMKPKPKPEPVPEPDFVPQRKPEPEPRAEEQPAPEIASISKSYTSVSSSLTDPVRSVTEKTVNPLDYISVSSDIREIPPGPFEKLIDPAKYSADERLSSVDYAGILGGSIEEMDSKYMAAVESGDMETAQAMVNARADQLKAEVFAMTDTPAYRVRRKAPPKVKKKVYKVFTMSPDGKPTALFVSSNQKLPVGVWLDAKDTFHFVDQKNGLAYVPSTKNPYSDGGATGSQVQLANISDEDISELEKRGYIKKGKNGKYPKSITALAYRPGWHAGDLPFFPQGGMRGNQMITENGVTNAFYDPEKPGSNYTNIHRYNQVVYECEIAYDVDYTSYNEKGALQDMQEMPEDGGYAYSTNPMTQAEDLGKWYISSSLKIVRPLSQEECDSILQKKGRLPQEWEERDSNGDLVTTDDVRAITDEEREQLKLGKVAKDAKKRKALDKEGIPYYRASDKSWRYSPNMEPPTTWVAGRLDLEALGYRPDETDGGKKLLDPVTYDNNGNPIPLSQRFNADVEDVRYSSVDYRGKNLVALHNLNERKLSLALDLGGFPMPSIAVTKADIPHENFGDVTLLFGRDTIDPRKSRKNKVYSADAWTPTFPRIDYEADPDSLAFVQSDLRRLQDRMPEYYGRYLNSYIEDFDRQISNHDGLDGVISSIVSRDRHAFKAAMLAQRGESVEIPMHDVSVPVQPDFNPEHADRYRKLIDAYPGDFDSLFSGKPKARQVIESYGRDRFKEAFAPIFSEETGLSMEDTISLLDNQPASFFAYTLRSAYRWTHSDGTAPATSRIESQPDYSAADNALDSRISDAELRTWLEDLFSGVSVRSGVRNNKDLYTDLGYRRSFSQTHDAVTLENIARIMARENNGNSKNAFGFAGSKSLRADTARSFSSVADIHRNEDRLNIISEEEYNARSAELNTRLYDLLSSIPYKGSSGNFLIDHDTLGEILSEAAQTMNWSPENITRFFAKYRIQLTPELAQEASQLLQDISEMPVSMFEAKPARPVEFSEVRAAVLPEGFNPEIVSRLKDNGIPVHFYDPSDPGARNRMVDSVASVSDGTRFSSLDFKSQASAYLAGSILDSKRIAAREDSGIDYSGEENALSEKLQAYFFGVPELPALYGAYPGDSVPSYLDARQSRAALDELERQRPGVLANLAALPDKPITTKDGWEPQPEDIVLHRGHLFRYYGEREFYNGAHWEKFLRLNPFDWNADTLVAGVWPENFSEEVFLVSDVDGKYADYSQNFSAVLDAIKTAGFAAENDSAEHGYRDDTDSILSAEAPEERDPFDGFGDSSIDALLNEMYTDELIDAADMYDYLSGRLDPEDFEQQSDRFLYEHEEESRSDKLKDAVGSLYRSFVDTGDEIMKMSKELSAPHLYQLFNLARSSSSVADYMIGRAMVSVNGVVRGESLESILKPVKDKGGDYWQNFQLYVYHLQNADRIYSDSDFENLKQFEADFAALRKKYAGLEEEQLEFHAVNGDENAMRYFTLKSDIINLRRLVKPVFGWNFNKSDSLTAAAELESRYPEFENIAARLYEYSDGLLDFRVQCGLITAKEADRHRKMYPHYVPTMRARDVIGKNLVDEVEIGKTVYRAGFSDDPIIPLDEALASITRNVVREGRKNLFGLALYHAGVSSHGNPDGKYILNAESSSQNEDVLSDWQDDLLRERNTNHFTIRDGNHRITLTLTDAMMDGINSLTPANNVIDNPALKIIRDANILYKELITSYNPMFILRNFNMDIQDGLLFSKDPRKFARNYPVAMKEIAENGRYWQQYCALGGAHYSYYGSAHGGVYSGQRSPLAKLNHGVASLNLVIEQAPRLSEFISTLQNGGSVEEAMLNAADVTVNFGRSGSTTKVANQLLVPFFNPSVQDFDRIIRLVRGDLGIGIFSLVLRCAAFGIAPSLINLLLGRDEDDWDDMNERDRDRNFLFPLGYQYWLRIPRGRVMTIFNAIVNNTDQVLRGNEVSPVEIFTTLASQMGPTNPINDNIISPFVRAKLFDPDNPGKTWYGGDLESDEMRELPPEQRYDSETDDLSIALGKRFGLSPKKIHDLLDSYTGVIGDIGLPLLTSNTTTSRNPLANAFIYDTVMRNRLGSAYHDNRTQIEQMSAGGDHAAELASRAFESISKDLSRHYDALPDYPGIPVPSGKKGYNVYRYEKSRINDGYRIGAQLDDEFISRIQRNLDSGMDDDAAYASAVAETLGQRDALQILGRSLSVPDNDSFGSDMLRFAVDTYGKSSAEQLSYLRDSEMSSGAKKDVFRDVFSGSLTVSGLTSDNLDSVYEDFVTGKSTLADLSSYDEFTPALLNAFGGDRYSALKAASVGEVARLQDDNEEHDPIIPPALSVLNSLIDSGYSESQRKAVAVYLGVGSSDYLKMSPAKIAEQYDVYSRIPAEAYAFSKDGTSGFTSLKSASDNETISNSKGALIAEYVYAQNYGLDKDVTNALLERLGVGKTVRGWTQAELARQLAVFRRKAGVSS